jgi:hypothetical protein
MPAGMAMAMAAIMPLGLWFQMVDLLVTLQLVAGG